ncbi:UDP-glucose:glycoprotein glucosyltransferase 1-like [Amphiura filiformis]|uniref:UDP-glucose:glycoprotein glucosyltransferase 1-like n=1 Tax=Amphiura filiformis TaxID=82378 RepID=UPI003B21C7ED
MATSMKSMMLHYLYLLFMLVQCHAAGRSKPITTSLDAKWGTHSVALEIAEFLAEKNNDDFWGYVFTLRHLTDMSDQAIYNQSLQFASKYLSPTEQNLLILSLAMHSYSPKIEMYNQIALDLPPPADCDSFVDIHGEITCNPDEVPKLIKSVSDRPPPSMYKVDHHYPGSNNNPIVAILYGDVSKWKTDSHSFHKVLMHLARDGKINYVLRHYIMDPNPKKVRLSGYGVELAIKSTEYKAVDDTDVKEGSNQEQQQEEDLADEVQGFVFSKLKQQHPDLAENLNEWRNFLLESTTKITPLKVWQLQNIAFQSAQRILSSSGHDALRMMRDISQNFPLMARTVVKTQVDDKVRREIRSNQKTLQMQYGIGPGDSLIMIDGLMIDTDVADPYMMLDLLRSEGKLLQGLYQLGVKGEDLNKLLRIQVESNEGDFAVDVRDQSVMFINDLEMDSRYQHWPSSIQEMLRPVFPGMMRYMRKNIFHLVFMLDPTTPDSDMMFQLAEMFYTNEAPVRIGIVFVVNEEADVDGHEDAGVAMVRAFNFALQDDGGDAAKALDLLIKIHNIADGNPITVDNVIDTFEKMFKGEDIQDIIGLGSDYDEKRPHGAAFFEKTALGSLPQVMLNGVPFTKQELEPDNFEETVVSSIMQNTPEIQRAVYQGKINDRTDILEWLMDKPRVMPRLNPRVLSGDNQIVEFAGQLDAKELNSTDFSTLSSTGMTASMIENIKYLTKREESTLRPVTEWIVCDLATKPGRQLLHEAVKNLKSSNDVRVGVIHNPSSAPNKEAHWLARAAYTVQVTQTRNFAKNFISKLLKESNYQSIVSGKSKVQDYEVNGMNMGKFNKLFKSDDISIVESHQLFSGRVLGLSPGQRAIVANGRIFGPLGDEEKFIGQDFTLVEKLILATSAGDVTERVKTTKVGKIGDKDELTNLVMKLDALVAASPRSENRRELNHVEEKHSVLILEPRSPEEPSFEIVAVLDPLTRDCQKWSHILLVLSQSLNVKLKVFMNPKDKASEMPLKSFYRYVFEPEMTFRVDSSSTAGPSAKFYDMPPDTLLTMNLLTPESWLVEAVRSIYDLDNIKLVDVETGIQAEYELENLLLEGHCFELPSGSPPRGLQFTLGTQNQPVMVDTIVMANLGYFQLKATPGAMLLRLRQGRSADIYDISSHDGTDSSANSEDIIVIMDSFKAKIVKVKVNKKPGKEEEGLLSEPDEAVPKAGGGGIWDSISSSISSLTGGSGASKKQKEPSSEGEETLNIFSIASGHLYERFLRIMMLSVLKNTKSPVKFWFVKNFLSPTFKDFIPHMAEEYGFEYELVQYKWPRWLHQQTEKQRMIWGYKILFLDVLFPLDVKKIIFVDADQIVRADLQELADLDLNGAPYGYTPFCESRREMDGFRFWKSGYWASHLAGRKYHISALYVVDLLKFRKIAAGDRLRGQYQALSQDPNSLANLDQDLPNNMIHQVSIKSLPQEWLWCETWCSDGEKRSAKTIDLCNNPLTKEPKLTAAVRIVSEWGDYDNEVKRLQEKLYKERNQGEEEEVQEEEASPKKDDDHTEL